MLANELKVLFLRAMTSSILFTTAIVKRKYLKYCMDGEVLLSNDFVAEAPGADTPFVEIVHKLENKAKHLEATIKQNRRRGETLCRECFNSMCAAEILAFDLLVIEHLTGTASTERILEFVDSCITPQFSVASSDPAETDACAAHIRSLHDQIQSSLEAVSATGSHSTSEKDVSDLITSLNAKVESIQVKPNTSPEEPPNPPLNLEIPVPEPTEEKVNINPAFLSWMKTALKPGAVAIDPKTAELRALFGTVLHRLQKVEELRRELTSLKASTASTRNLTFEDCEPSAVYESPFYRAMENSCKFLVAAQRHIQEQQKLIPGCMRAMELCKAHLQNLKAQSTATVEKLKEYRANLETSLQKLKEEKDELQKEWMQHADSLFVDTKGITLSMWIKLLEPLSNEIVKRLQSVQEQTTDIETLAKLAATLKTLQQLRTMVENILTRCKENMDLTDQKQTGQFELFTLVWGECTDEEIVRVNELEVRDTAEYHENLQTIIDMMKVDEITAWCDELQTVSECLARAVSDQKEIEKQVMPLLEESFGVKEVAKLKQDLENVIDMNAQLAEQEVALKAQTADLVEELFQVSQELGAYEEEEDGEDIAMCPVCQTNERNCIVTPCLHPICKSCAEASRESHKCPVCQQEYPDDGIKPFYLQ